MASKHQPKHKLVSLVIPIDDYEWLAEMAKEAGEPVNDFAEKIMLEVIEYDRHAHRSAA